MIPDIPSEDDPSISIEDALQQLEQMNVDTDQLPVEPVNNTTEAVNQGSLADILTKDIQDMVLSILKLDKNDFSPTTPLMDYGLDSIAATEIGNLFTSRYDIVIPPTVFFEFPDLQSFVKYLLENHFSELQKTYPDSKLVEQNNQTTINRTVTSVTPVTTSVSPVVENSPVKSTSTVVPVEVETPKAEAKTNQIGELSIENLWEMSEPAETISSVKEQISVQAKNINQITDT